MFNQSSLLLTIVLKTKENSSILKPLSHTRVLGHLIGMLSSKFSDNKPPQDTTLTHFTSIPSNILIKN